MLKILGCSLICISLITASADKSFFSKPVKTIHGFNMIVDERDGCVSKSIKESKEWESLTGKVLKALIREDSIIIHLGAHIGYFDVFIGKLLGEKGKIYTFEPSPEMFSLLKENLDINNVKNVDIRQKAVSSKSGKTTLVYSLGNTGGATIAQDLGKHEKEFDVDVVTLDDEFKDMNNIDLLFMDIEGFEYEAIKGARKLLQENKSAYILMEFSKRMFDRAHSDLDEFLKFIGTGYKVYKLDENSESLEEISITNLKETEDDLMNILLVHNSKNFDFFSFNRKLMTIYNATLKDGFDFSKDGIPSFIKSVKGLSKRESWGRWSDEKLSDRVSFDFVEPLSENFTLKINGIAFEDNAEKHMEIDVCGISSKIKLHTETIASVKIDLKGKKCSTINFLPPFPKQPSNGDIRKIAFGFKKISIE